ncbi:hypothetical protein BIT28_16430 [Photobacterium proteolyticum]|uniref:Uncharacterized protein n=1 Tax=Photobacterium proteolyticum TaxID=1903952 RepID=A0A1Q9G7P9_9GAMM|nr:hypothetical protein [Photobacterium proteolyticum]OLQ70311.1 hypothetical protein BIT28_16430 [Photobacterium proteolyticum]
MQQPENGVLEPQEAMDDWGDFSAVIGQLEQQETDSNEALTDAVGTESAEDNSEAIAGFLDITFTVVEQVTSLITGVEFEFDAKGKEKVIEAAQPVLNKHGSGLMGVFGDYMEEATLFIAVLSLAYTSRCAYMMAKQEQLKGEADNGKEETEAATAA